MPNLRQLELAGALALAACSGGNTPNEAATTGAGGASSSETVGVGGASSSETVGSGGNGGMGGSGGAESCTLEKLIAECGYELDVVGRETWGAPLQTQNNPIDTTDPNAVMQAILNGNYPPYSPWPKSVGFPDTYNLGNELAPYGFDWPVDQLDWPVEKQPFINTLVVHYTAGSSNGDCEEYARQVTNFHTFERGWGDIGYQFMVCEDGSVKVYQGRAEVDNPDADPEVIPELKDDVGQWNSAQSIGAHVEGQNTGKLGISLALAEGETPSAQEVEIFKQATARVALRVGAQPGINVAGHQDLAATECPGGLYPYMAGINQRVQDCLECRANLP